jgi:hypothetical protein
MCISANVQGLTPLQNVRRWDIVMKPSTKSLSGNEMHPIMNTIAAVKHKEGKHQLCKREKHHMIMKWSLVSH